MSNDDSSVFVDSLARSHGSRLRRFLTGRVRNMADVPDLVQEVFLRMLRVGDPAVIRSPEAYLFAVATHVAQQHALNTHTAPTSAESMELLAKLEAATDADPALQVDSEQALEQTLRALQALSPKVRATFILHRHYGMTLKEIACELNISFPMAKKYLVRALAQFRQHLGTS